MPDDKTQLDKFKQAARMRAIVIVGALLPSVAFAQGLPPLPQSIARASAVSCIKIDETGAVSGAFLITSTGDAARDRDLITWIKQLHWPAAKPGEKRRTTWFPMPIATGEAPLPEPPPACAPKAGL